jgi:hypothetical protein
MFMKKKTLPYFMLFGLGLFLSTSLSAQSDQSQKPGTETTFTSRKSVDEQKIDSKKNRLIEGRTTTTRSVTEIQEDIQKVQRGIEQKKKIEGYDLTKLQDKLAYLERELKIARRNENLKK